MEVCFQLARKGKGSVSPNPLVGSALVRDGQIVSHGYHRRFGGPHAEVECIRRYKGDFRGTTLYVNLEPCSHYGKTPPCTGLIIDSGIRNVVVGMTDPNPLVHGRGIRKLRAAGIKVITGVLHEDAEELNRAFTTFVLRRRPFVHVKIAQTLDGRIAFEDGRPLHITNKHSQKLVHQWRAEHDAVVVGAGTVRTDDPLLTVRMVKGRDPIAIVLDGGLSLRADHRLWKTASRRRVLLVTNSTNFRAKWKKVRELRSNGIEVIPVESKDSQISLREVLKELYRMNIGSVLVEGGSNVFSQFLGRSPMDRLSVFVAPRFLGNGIPAFVHGCLASGLSRFRRSKLQVSAIGTDALLQFDLGQTY